MALCTSCRKEESKQLHAGRERSASAAAITVDTAWDDPDTLLFKHHRQP